MSKGGLAAMGLINSISSDRMLREELSLTLMEFLPKVHNLVLVMGKQSTNTNK